MKSLASVQSTICLVLAMACLMLGDAAATALGQDAAPPAGITLFSSDIHDAAESALGNAPPAMSLVAPRGGHASAKVVLRSGGSITGLKAALGSLRQGDTVLAASQFQVRYGIRWDLNFPTRPSGCDILLESPPATVEPNQNGAALVAVWVTAEIPQNAKPGTYTGTLTVEAAGLKPVAVPVTIRVAPWTLPPSQAWRTWIELIQSPDTLAAEYGVPLWSEKHWTMIARSMHHIGQLGSRVVYIPLICGTNQGNAQSMVRWAKKPGGAYAHDFTIMDRYLDLAQKHMGTPKLVVFYAWEASLKPPKEEVVIGEGDSSYVKMEKEKAAARFALRDRGPAVSLLNPSTGQVEPFFLPKYNDPASRALWEPVWKAIRAKMAQRGLEKAMILGVASDAQPEKDEVKFLADISGGLPWTTCSHHARWVNAPTPTSKSELYGLAPVDYAAVALDFQFTFNPARERTYGWKKPILHAIYWRFSYFIRSSHAAIRNEAECNITGNQRGIAHLGADFWPTVRDNRGRRVGSVADRYPESYWHSLNIGGWMLGNGPDGPVGTARLELMREGVQECEARIAIEAVLTTPALKARLGGDLAQRAQALLDQRQLALWKARGATEAAMEKGYMSEYREIYQITKTWKAPAGNAWFIGSSWQDRTADLYAMAAEVEAKVK